MDIEVTIHPRLTAYFRGTKEQLLAEGLIEPGFEFPKAYDHVGFTRDGQQFELRRHRPRDLKGPRRLYPDVDYWTVTIDPKRKSPVSPVMYELQQRMAERIFLESPTGQAQLFRYFNARSDAAFQGFMSATVGTACKWRKA